MKRSHHKKILASFFVLALAACGGTVAAPEIGAGINGCLDEADCPSSTACLVYRCSEQGQCEGIVPSNPECHDGGSDAGGTCDPGLPLTASSPTGCCPAGCAPLDPPVNVVYCIDQTSGGAC